MGVIAKGSEAAVLEVNCETDFVSRNEMFQKLALDSVEALIASEEFKSSLEVTEDSSVQDLNISELSKLTDLKSDVMSFLKENILFGKARKVSYHQNVALFSSVHPVLKNARDSNSMFGKFVSLVALKKKSDDVNMEIVNAFGQQLAYHIIGMNPQTLHAVEKSPEHQPEKNENSLNLENDSEVSESAEVENKDEDEFMPEQTLADDQTALGSDALIEQNFIFDSERTVGEICEDLKVEIVEFHRFELK